MILEAAWVMGALPSLLMTKILPLLVPILLGQTLVPLTFKADSEDNEVGVHQS